jgi:SM-20-related protein
MFSEQVINDIVAQLVDNGYIVYENILPMTLSNSLLKRIQSIDNTQFNPAKIGRNNDQHQNSDIRNDSTLWLEGKDEAEAHYLEYMESLKQAMNRQLYMGLDSYECHFSHYKQGAFYQKHYDAFKGKSNRLLTTVFYLNNAHSDGDGGELIIYDDNDNIIQEVEPKIGTMVIFLSEKFPHEVLKTNKNRYAIAGWFKQR